MCAANNIPPKYMPGRWRTSYHIAKNIKKSSFNHIKLTGDLVTINGTPLPTHFPFIKQMSGLSITLAPSTENDMISNFKFMNLLLKGLYHKDLNLLKSGFSSDSSYNVTFPRSLMSIYLPAPYNMQEIIGLFENNNVFKDSSDYNLFQYLSMRTWNHSANFNNTDRLLNTCRAFLNKPPIKTDSFMHRELLRKKTELDLHNIFTDKKTQFIQFSQNNHRDITFANRYLPITDMLNYYLFENNILNYPLIKKINGVSEIRRDQTDKKNGIFSILEVGGAPYSLKHGAPAIRDMVDNLRSLHPDIKFKVTVVDINFPNEFGITENNNISVKDSKYPEITYQYGNILNGNLAGFDVVLCSRVLNQKHFTGEAKDGFKNYALARQNLYTAVKPGGLLFLDQGNSPFMELWVKQRENINKDNYIGLINRIDNWFLVEQMDIFNNHERYINNFVNGKCNEMERRIIAKYYRVFLDDPENRIQANLLWRICMPNKQIKITEKLKTELLPNFLKKLTKENPALRTYVSVYIDTLTDINKVDLRCVDKLNKVLSDYNIPFEVDKVKLLESKLESTGLDKALVDAAKDYLSNSKLPKGKFSTLNGLIKNVKISPDEIRITYKINGFDKEHEFFAIIDQKTWNSKRKKYSKNDIRIYNFKESF